MTAHSLGESELSPSALNATCRVVCHLPPPAELPEPTLPGGELPAMLEMPDMGKRGAPLLETADGCRGGRVPPCAGLAVVKLAPGGGTASTPLGMVPGCRGVDTAEVMLPPPYPWVCGEYMYGMAY